MNKILLGFIAIGLFALVGCRTSKRNISTITDFEGNSYKTVKIGTQEWMAENLNSKIFCHGYVIPEAKTAEEWKKAGKNKEPAWCYYDNDNQYDTIYGKLYNWYAVERGTLCPTGWHVPTDAEWTLLIDYLATNGQSGAKGTALKATSGWKDIRFSDGTSGNGTDDYGFSGLPGGHRTTKTGNFYSIGDYGNWWSSSQNDAYDAWYRGLDPMPDFVDIDSRDKGNGMSVRCLRD